jgi:sortase (surface protein transpeptidase)
MIRNGRLASATIATLMTATGCYVSKKRKKKKSKQQSTTTTKQRNTKSANGVNGNMKENTKVHGIIKIAKIKCGMCKGTTQEL